ncbi:hypothetical protein GOHSU_06_00400 [Gordonia hirsuta DSM 44140 = NBRC 16056]|uniref:DUF5652 domain-containing protein n=1 Tax=Gordonia hirsuta DSM 44140 = NBRC 16056 TaxID=1121927 RepID=L7L8S4_9ACTN|nr:DUF5652 family protein [Gordonia hirsuta]GAC56428.1 hypothetical protein GOHSU_06_00400 [Gordonia hirsuta DSM 44140 = NBRC 16056]
MLKTAWNQLTTGQKSAIIAVTAVDAGLRAWAGRDLAGRPAEQVAGPKWLWTLGLSVVNSVGVLPVIYLLRGRRRPTDA